MRKRSMQYRRAVPLFRSAAVGGASRTPCYPDRRSLRAFEKAPPDVQEILTKPIKELGLKLEGSPLERYVQRLYRELERKGIKQLPAALLSDRRVGLPVRRAGHRHPVLPRRPEARAPREGR